jgi:hypothetical protein
MNQLLIKNTRREVSILKFDTTIRKKRLKLIIPTSLIVEKVVLSISRGSRELHIIVSVYDYGSYLAII